MKNIFTLLYLVVFFSSCSVWVNRSKVWPGYLELQTDQQDGKDARVDTWYPDKNVGDRSDIQVKYWTIESDPALTRAFLEFDLSSIPVGSKITSALLSLYYWPENSHSKLSATNACWIQRVIEPWEEESITWNHQPRTISKNQVALKGSLFPEQDFTDIDVTQLIQDIVNDPENSH